MAEQITEATLVTARAGKPKLKATPKPTAPAGVSKSDETAAVQNQILSLLEEVVAAKQAPTAASQPAPVPSADTADPVAANGYMPPQYQAIFERYFDPADGFTARLVFPEVTESGAETGGITFTIAVPDKFSNVTPAHKELYKVDLRTRALMPNSIAKGIEEWRKKVANNLKYNKNIKAK